MVLPILERMTEFPSCLEEMCERVQTELTEASLDGDFYSSIKESLEHVYPRLSPNSIVVIDDYYDPSIHKPMQRYMNNNTHNLIEGVQYQIENSLPGVKAACDEFFLDKPESISILVSGRERQGYFTKKNKIVIGLPLH